jgi:hypothetical protein
VSNPRKHLIGVCLFLMVATPALCVLLAHFNGGQKLCAAGFGLLFAATVVFWLLAEAGPWRGGAQNSLGGTVTEQRCGKSSPSAGNQASGAPPATEARWASWAEWPPGHIIGAEPPNTTHDYHATKEQAEAVCDMLRRDGLGGERCHFPVRVWVTPPTAGRVRRTGGRK